MPPRHQIVALERAAVLSTIRSQGPVSRADVARSLGLRPSSVTELVRQLFEEGVITEVGQGGSNGGRPPVLLDVDRTGNYALGVTIELRGVTAAIVRWDGVVISRCSTGPVGRESSAAALECQAIDAAEHALQDARVPLDRVRGAGVGVSALVDAQNNEALFSSTFPAAGRFRMDAFARHFGLPVYLEDIAYLMGLGERWFVYPGERRPLVFLLVSSGTCGAVIEPWAQVGTARFAAEFGHMVVDSHGPLCGCGKRGCLEAFVSETALVATASRLLGQPGAPPTSLEDVAARAALGETAALRIIAATSDHLGVAITNLANVFAPAIIVLGGSVLECWGPWLVPDVVGHVRSHLMVSLQDRVEIVPTRLGGDASLLGSAARALEAFFAAPQMSLA